MALNPLPGRVFIEPDDATSYVTKSGFHIGGSKHTADKLRKPPIQGWIRHLAKDLSDEPFKVGDKVVFDEPNPKGFKLDGERLIPIKANQIIAIVGE